MIPDYYVLLGIPVSASAEQAKHAFRRMARQYHPDLHPGQPHASEQFQLIYQAYKVLTTPKQRARYDQARALALAQPFGPTGNAHYQAPTWIEPDWAAEAASYHPDLELRCSLDKNQIAALPTEQVFYALSELVPMSSGQTLNWLPLNLCLVVDRSGSMRGEKLSAVKMGLRQLIEGLEPEDILSIVAFDNRPEVMVQAERHQFPHVLSDIVDSLHERGGTTIGEALVAALEEVSRFSHERMTSHIILLTDGQTYGDDERCLELAQMAHQQGISITTMGIGTDWNEGLLSKIAANSQGTVHYLERASSIAAALELRVSALRGTLASNVRVSLALSPNTRLRRVTRVIPDIAELWDVSKTTQQAESSVQLEIGEVATTRQGVGLSLLWELLLPAQTIGQYVIGQVSVRYDIPSANFENQSKREQLAVTFVEPHVYTNMRASQRVHQVLEYVTAHRLQQRAQAIARQDAKKASALLHTASLRLHDLHENTLAEEAQAQAELLAQQGEMDRSASLRLQFGTKYLGQRPPEATENQAPTQEGDG